MGRAVWRVTEKPINRSFFGACQLLPKKKVCLSTQLGACSHLTGRPTVPYWCTIDVRTPWARHGVLMGPPGPRRPAGGTVWLIFIGGPRFGRPTTPIGAGRGYCLLPMRICIHLTPSPHRVMLLWPNSTWQILINEVPNHWGRLQEKP